MLSHALAHRYGVAPPRYVNNHSSNEIIGHPRHPRLHPHVPRIASSHSIAPHAIEWAWLRDALRVPPYAVVVRDIRDVLISAYEKWRPPGVSFSEFVAGDARARRYVCDVWWYVRFLNRWGDVARRYPDQTLVLRYEDFRRDPQANLRRLGQHFGLDLADADLAAGVAVGSKAAMAACQDPAVEERPVREDGQGDARFTADDLKVLAGILHRRLRHDFGYPYFAVQRGYWVGETPMGAASWPARMVAGEGR